MWKRTSQHKIEILQADEFSKFAALLKAIPMGCKGNVLADPTWKTHSVNFLTFEENTRKPYNDNFCLLRALALHFPGKEELERANSKFFNPSLEKTGGTDLANLRKVCMEGIALVEDMV